MKGKSLDWPPKSENEQPAEENTKSATVLLMAHLRHAAAVQRNRYLHRFKDARAQRPENYKAVDKIKITL